MQLQNGIFMQNLEFAVFSNGVSLEGTHIHVIRSGCVMSKKIRPL